MTFDPEQPRDDKGQWAGGSGNSGGAPRPTGRPAAAAIRLPDGTVVEGRLTHYDALEKAMELGLLPKPKYSEAYYRALEGSDTGYVDDTHKYLTREEAARRSGGEFGFLANTGGVGSEHIMDRYVPFFDAKKARSRNDPSRIRRVGSAATARRVKKL